MNSTLKLNSIVEKLEDESETLYSQVTKRYSVCSNFAVSKYYAGEPDMLYIVRESKRKKSFFNFRSKTPVKYSNKNSMKYLGNKSEKFGAYHYVYGFDTADINAISEYVKKFVQKTNKILEMSGKYKESRYCPNEDLYEILSNSNPVQAIFCSFDIFTEKDFRFIYNIPGGLNKFYYIGRNSRKQKEVEYEITEDALNTLFLSSVLRCWCFNNEKAISNSVFFEEIN